MRLIALLFASVVTLGSCAPASAQQADSTPGHYDFYLLNLSWSPEFCDTLNTLTPAEKAARTSAVCSAPHGFVVHGLWPQNGDGTYPANCSDRPGPRNWKRYIDITPDLDLLRHEWTKHGTCTTLSPDAFFGTERLAFAALKIPSRFKRVTEPLSVSPDVILADFYRANPSFPQGSFAVACSKGRFTAIEACFSRDVQPIACQRVSSCAEGTVIIEPDASGQIVR